MADTTRKTILIVDDIAANLEILFNILIDDYTIKAAKCGKKALEIAQTFPVHDLILLDVMMPDMNGFETCRLLKSSPISQGIPVIFVSSQTEVVDEASGFAVGGVDYITKPVSPTIVKARVKTHLSLSTIARELTLQNLHLQENISLLERIEQIARHDLKSPLTVFMGASDFMGHDKNLNNEQLEFLRILDQSALKMLNMIDHSLDLAKMERGEYKLNPVSINVAHLVRLIVRELESLAKAKSVEFAVILNDKSLLDSDSCLVMSEMGLLTTIVSNLAKNAIEASPAGGKVVISLIDQNLFLIEISNLGEIPAEIRHHFMERYVTCGKEKGTGLGGYSAKLAAQTMGGEIRFISSQETGTVITVSIPHQAQSEV
ncbi:MAG: response regulator [Candidatus Riflebacteria bacterium]|nr:response regulator [Candidatus Riflebacteria bacterium]